MLLFSSFNAECHFFHDAQRRFASIETNDLKSKYSYL